MYVPPSNSKITVNNGMSLIVAAWLTKPGVNASLRRLSAPFVRLVGLSNRFPKTAN